MQAEYFFKKKQVEAKNDYFFELFLFFIVL